MRVTTMASMGGMGSYWKEVDRKYEVGYKPEAEGVLFFRIDGIPGTNRILGVTK